jgi:hypothetical protein
MTIRDKPQMASSTSPNEMVNIRNITLTEAVVYRSLLAVNMQVKPAILKDGWAQT